MFPSAGRPELVSVRRGGNNFPILKKPIVGVHEFSLPTSSEKCLLYRDQRYGLFSLSDEE